MPSGPLKLLFLKVFRVAYISLGEKNEEEGRSKSKSKYELCNKLWVWDGVGWI